MGRFQCYGIAKKFKLTSCNLKEVFVVPDVGGTSDMFLNCDFEYWYQNPTLQDNNSTDFAVIWLGGN